MRVWSPALPFCFPAKVLGYIVLKIRFSNIGLSKFNRCIFYCQSISIMGSQIMQLRLSIILYTSHVWISNLFQPDFGPPLISQHNLMDIIDPHQFNDVGLFVKSAVKISDACFE